MKKTSIKLMCLMSLCGMQKTEGMVEAALFFGASALGGMHFLKEVEKVWNAKLESDARAIRERGMPSEGEMRDIFGFGFMNAEQVRKEEDQKKQAKMLEAVPEEKVVCMKQNIDEELAMKNQDLEKQVLELREALEARSNSSRSGRTSRSSSSKGSSERYQTLQARHDELLLALEDARSRSSSSKSSKTSRSSSSKGSSERYQVLQSEYNALQAERDALLLALEDRSRSSSSRPRTPSEISVETTPSIEVWTRGVEIVPTPQDLSPRSVDSRTEPAPSESASSASTWIIPPSL